MRKHSEAIIIIDPIAALWALRLRHFVLWVIHGSTRGLGCVIGITTAASKGEHRLMRFFSLG
jgi:hypothetical protein